ncbi:MAG TPA: MFS transporter, partial [Bacteroidota bacterium]
MVQPIFALFVESLEVSREYLATITGAIFSVTGVFTVLSAPWWGKRNDRKGYRMNLLVTSSVAGLAYIAHSVMGHALALIPVRAVLGVCLGGIIPPLYSFISKNTETSRRGGIMGIASSFYILANILGPVTGGSVAGQFGIRGAFIVSGMILFSVAFFIWRFFFDVSDSAESTARTADEQPTYE